jgi:IS66 C-terminal element
MRGARPEYDEPSARTVDATDIGSQHPARYGQNDCEIALGRKNHLFAGSDGGGEQWAVIASLVETCKMNAVDPQAYLHDVLSKIVARHPMGRIDELLPFAYAPAAEKAAA